MKSEQQFIKDMWQQVDRIEQEELEKEQVFLTSRKLSVRDILMVTGMVILTAAILMCFKLYGTGSIYFVAILLIVIAYISDYLINSWA